MTFIRKADFNYRNQLSVDGRTRISPQILIGDYKQHNDIAGGSYNTELIGTGAFVYENSGVGATELQVTTTSDAVVRQSYQWHNYFAGKPTKSELTASYFQPQTDVIKRMGYFSATTTTPFDANKDGMYFESSGGTIFCKVLRNGTEVFSLAQSSWLNQSELSAYDPTDFNFYMIEFLYLGGAIVNFWIETEFGLTKVASYQHINVDQNTFVKSPTQPIRYEIRSTGGAGVFNQICANVVVEGFDATIGIVNSHNNGSDTVSIPVAGTRYAMLGIRQAATSRNIVIDIRSVSILANSSDNLLVELYFGGTTATAPTFNPLAFSNIEGFDANTLATAPERIHSGGVKIASLYAAGGGTQDVQADASRRLGSYINGAVEEAYICATPLTTNANGSAAINWTEFI